MQTAFFAVIALVALMYAECTRACDCGHQGTIESTREHATAAVVIRVLAAELLTGGNDVSYRFEVVDPIVGYIAGRTVLSSARQCCGTRIDVGDHYLVFVGKGQAFTEIHEGNAFPLLSDYGDWERRLARALVSGTRDFRDVRRVNPGWMSAVPPPPPPPCPEFDPPR